MRAKIHGIDVEGTMDEILAFKDVLDERERKSYNKVTFHHQYVQGSDVSKFAEVLMKQLATQGAKRSY